MELIDLTGKRFGKLGVTHRGQNAKGGQARWVCLCDCGKTITIQGTYLRNGRTSCGCAVVRGPDLTGRRFGKLIAQQRAGFRTAYKKGIQSANGGRHSEVLWQCLCDCGKLHPVTTHDLLSGNTSSCGCSQHRYGKDHPNFTHGLSPKGNPSLEYRLWSKAKERAKEEGVPFKISPLDVIVPASCPVLGIPIYPGIGKQTPNSPSLDKIIPQLGYVRGNIKVVSYRANTIKQNATAEELRKVADYVERESLALKGKANAAM